MANILHSLKAGYEEKMIRGLDLSGAQPLAADVVCQLPPGKIATLSAAIDHKLAGRNAPAVHFTSVHGNADNTCAIAFETAYSAARASGKRVLFLDASRQTGGIAAQLKACTKIALDDFIRQETGPGHTPFSMIEGTSFFYARLSLDRNANAAPDAQLQRILFEKLKTLFDMIVVCSDNAINGGDAATLAALSDGTIIVVDAEQTRLPVVRECAEILKTGGGRMIGTVLGGRRHYIPRWLYGMLFQPKKA